MPVVFKNLKLLKMFTICSLDPFQNTLGSYGHHNTQIRKTISRKFRKNFFDIYFGDGLYHFDLSYITLLTNISFKKLDSRRIISSLLFMHKIINGQNNYHQLLARIQFSVPQFNRRNGMLLYISTHCSNLGLNSPMYRACHAVIATLKMQIYCFAHMLNSKTMQNDSFYFEFFKNYY